jgi:hypothetical protein
MFRGGTFTTQLSRPSTYSSNDKTNIDHYNRSFGTMYYDYYNGAVELVV